MFVSKKTFHRRKNHDKWVAPEQKNKNIPVLRFKGLKIQIKPIPKRGVSKGINTQRFVVFE